MKLLAVALLVTACSGKADEPKPDPAGKPEPVPQPEAKPGKVEPPPGRTGNPPPQRDTGSCKVEVTGPANISEVIPGGVRAVALSYWADAKTRQMMFGDQQGMILNCDGKQISISFTANKLGEAELPYAPKKYTLGKGQPVRFLGRLLDDSKTSLLGGEGTLEITAIDATHIAGTFDVQSRYLGKGTKGEATIKGSFDYKCPGTCK